jgi:hypothetical protein
MVIKEIDSEEETERIVNTIISTLNLPEKDILENVETAIVSDLAYAIPKFSDQSLMHIANLLTKEIEKRNILAKKEIERRLRDIGKR